jgi:hypothetical protein
VSDSSPELIPVTVSFTPDQDPAVCETLGGLAEAERPERVRQWARLGHLVMSMARVAPGKEAMREYLSDFTRDAEELREVIRDHLDMFRQKTARADGDLGERFVREQLFDAFKDEGDTFEVWSAIGHQGDLVGRMAAADRPPRRILIEVKDYTHPVPGGEVDKFRRDIRENTEMQAGIFVSLRTPITGVPGRVRLDVEDGRPVVYVAQEAAGQQLFIVAWSLLRGLLNRGERAVPTPLQDLARMSAQRIQEEVEQYLADVSDYVSRIETISRDAGKIMDSASGIRAEAARLQANVNARAQSVGRVLRAEAATLRDASRSIPRTQPWSESEWRARFEKLDATDWDAAHGANLTALLRWMADFEGVSGTWTDKGMSISRNGTLRFEVTVLSNGLRITIPESLVTAAGIETAWEKDKVGQIKVNKGTSVNLDPTPILKALGVE